MNAESQPRTEVYLTTDGIVRVDVRSDGENVWLNRQQLAVLFARDVKTIGKHIANARREELFEISVVAKFATTAADGKTYQVEHYNIDMVLSVGYRVKSAEGIHFRRWANGVLKQYVVEGAALNQHRLDQLGSVVSILARSLEEMVVGVAEVLSQFLPSLHLLRGYDARDLTNPVGSIPEWRLSYDEAREVIDRIGAEFPEDTMLGSERGDALRGVIEAIYQGYAGSDLYPSTQQKAAHLLYFVVKDHPLADGNKRSAASLFVIFLAKNGALFDDEGQPVISNNALAALTLVVAMSEPKEKELMIALITTMLAGGAG